MRGFRLRNARRLRLRSCLRFSYFILFLRSITRPLAREEERLAQIAELACGRSEAEEKSQEREKNDTSGVHGGGCFAPHDTSIFFWILFTYAVLEHLRTAHHLPDGRFASRGTRRVIFVYPTPAQVLVAAHPAETQRTGTVWALVVELGPAPPRCPSES
jgi:hypothetical protein